MGQTRLNSLGLSGRKSDENRSDFVMQNVVVPLSAQPTASPIATGIFLPEGSVVLHAVQRVFVAEVTGTTKTVTVDRGGDDIITTSSVASTGTGGPALAAPVPSGTYGNSGTTDEINVTLGSADFAELEGEVVLNCLIRKGE